MSDATLSPPPAKTLFTANLICMASLFAWAAGLPAASLLIEITPSMQLGTLRILMAAGALLPLWLLVDGHRALAAAPWLRGIAIGSLFAISNWFMIEAQALSGAVTVAVITAAMPIIGITLEVVLDRRAVTLTLIIGLLLAVIGGVMVLDLRNGGFSLGLGALIGLVSIICYTLGSRLAVTALPGLSAIGQASLTISGAAITLSLLTGLRAAGGMELVGFQAWGLKEIGALAIFAVGGLAAAQVLWILGVSKLGVGVAALHANAGPFYVMLILFSLGAPWVWGQVGAAALVVLGVLVAQGVIRLPGVTR